MRHFRLAAAAYTCDISTADRYTRLRARLNTVILPVYLHITGDGSSSQAGPAGKASLVACNDAIEKPTEPNVDYSNETSSALIGVGSLEGRGGGEVGSR